MTVKEEIEMINQQSAAIRRTREELQEELEAIETASQSRCQCDGDYDDELGRYVACHSEICPEHDLCRDCDAKAEVIVDGDKLCRRCAEEGMTARWAESAGGVCLEVQNGSNHFCDPGGWRIIAFITPTVRRNGFVTEVGGAGLGLDFGFRPSTYRTLEEAKAAIVKATGVEIVALAPVEVA